MERTRLHKSLLVLIYKNVEYSKTLEYKNNLPNCRVNVNRPSNTGHL